jgi:predicted NUDIX family phosphoesterase
MAKLALCIKLADAPSEVIGAFKHSDIGRLIPINSEFWNTPVQLVDRSICETDESLLQLLPYITLEDEDGAFFMYTRGGGGEEARLHGNYSIGVGGHVDIAPAECQTLLEVLQAEAAREYLEETGLVADPSMFTITHFICDPTNAVGRVHLGLLTSLKLSADDRAALGSKLEAGVIENTCMARAPYLLSTEVYARLENWSKLIVDTMFNPEPAQPDDEANYSSFSFNDPGASAEAEAAQGDGDEDACEDDTCYECDLPAEECECHRGEEAGDSGDEEL